MSYLWATQQVINLYSKLKFELFPIRNLILKFNFFPEKGGNLATVISQKLMSENICRPKLQVLVYPLLQFFDFTLPSYRLNLPKRILGNIHHENFINFLHYLTGLQVDSSVFANGHTTGKQKELFSEYVNVNLLPAKFRNHNLESINLSNDTEEKFTKLTEIILDKDLSPLLVSDEFLKQNTPANTLLITAEMDVLRDDGFIYAERLNKQGNCFCYSSSKHFKYILIIKLNFFEKKVLIFSINIMKTCFMECST